ncbi:MAG: Clp protease ClpP [Lachnospiraceae bacterium]|nr:Clp protease ClpP [Lachnospiraceae bacterium]
MKEITINGTIVSNDDKWIYDWFEVESCCPKDIIKALQDAGEDDVTVLVNSGGGDLDAGNEIYSALKRYKGKTVAEITGYAASAATVICCGADTVRANAGIQYMIHNVSTWQGGDHRDMETMASVLKAADRSVANVYQQKTGLDEKTILGMMSTGTGNMGKWMDAKEAKEYGFIDEIIGDNGSLARPISIYNAHGAFIISDEVKEKIRLEFAGKKSPEFDSQKAQARLNLLKLKGGKVL